MRYRTAKRTRAARGILLVLALGMLHGCEFFLGTDVTTIDVPATFSVPIPIVLPTQAQLDAATDGVVVMPASYVPIDLVALVPELAEYDGNVNSVNVSEILHLVPSNTLNFEVRSIPIKIGPTAATFDDTSVTTLGSTVAVGPAVVQGQGVRANLIPLGQQQASDLMVPLRFGLGTQLTYAIPDGTTPSGSATMSLLFTITVVANP